MDLVIEANPDILFAYNEAYDSTNTSKSLLKALQLSHPGGVLWLNGDVVFDDRVLDVVADRIRRNRSFVCVNTDSVAEEEVKYTLDERGLIAELSKQVDGAVGEAVGVPDVGDGETGHELVGGAPVVAGIAGEAGVAVPVGAFAQV